jgi:hypothetical protein
MEKAEIEKVYNRTKFKLDRNDPELDCVTNLIYYGFLLIIHANKSNQNQLAREFDEHCFTATNFFKGAAVSGNAPQDRVAIVKDGAVWVNNVKEWVITGLSGRLAPKEFEPPYGRIEHLYSQQRELMARCNIMYKISIEESKNILLKKIEEAGQKASGEVEETGGNATPAKGWGIKVFFWKLYETTVKAICAAVLEWWRSQPK